MSSKRKRSSEVEVANGNGMRTQRPLVPGVYVPTLAFFDANEDLDLATTKQHAQRMAESGVAGIAVQGSNGEAVHLSNQERKDITHATRQALDESGFANMPIIVGAGAQSTREAIVLAKDAAEAGGDYLLVLPPSYFRANVPKESIHQYFTDIAEASPLPLLIYNFPAVAGGIDLSADDINLLAKHPKIVGCKLTCANIGKLQRITSKNVTATHHSKTGFMAMGGLADITIPVMVAGGSGIITGLGNIVPKACVSVYNLYAAGRVEEAEKAQAVVADGDWGVISGGVPGTRSALQTYFGYGGLSRRPLPAPTPGEVKTYAGVMKEIVKYEKSL